MPLIRKPDKETLTPEWAPADVLSALSNGTQQERWTAARAAPGVPGGAEALAAALVAEPDVRVREAIFTSLALIGSPVCLSAIVASLRGDDASVRTGALDALRAMPESVRDFLPALLYDGDSDIRLLSCEIARGLPVEEATFLLCDLLAHEPEANVCAAAIDVLAEVGGPSALPALAGCAARFPETPFLAFAIGIARDRILAQSMDSHG